MDYKNGKIYQITDLAYTKCYIGSTTQKLTNRLSWHKGNYTKWKNGNVKKYVTSLSIFDEFGIDNCKIELIENYPCESRDLLHKREGEIIRARECVNKRVPGRKKAQYRIDNIVYYKTIYICECGGRYQVNHKSRHFKTKLHQNYINSTIETT